MTKKILLVEDEKDIANLVSDLLARKGYEVTTAENGQDGLKTLETWTPDLILLDVMMPKMGGYDFVKSLKREESRKDIPVIVLTAKVLSYEAFKKEGVTDYLVKPFTPQELLEKVNRFFYGEGKMLNCPDDQQPLERTDYKGIAVHECSRCRGWWFDRRELQKAKDHADEDIRWLDFDPFGKSPDESLAVSADKDCPGCAQTMILVTYKESGVTIGRCEHCQSVWLPHGEFEKMIKYLEDLIAKESAAGYVKDSLKQFLEIASGSEDFGSELKDFLVVLKLLRLRLGVEHPTLAKTINKIYEYLPFM